MMKHAVAVNDPRGDQGHFGPCFMTFHRAFLLELELALLAVAPQLGAIPYWDITLDRPGQKYYDTDKFIFGDRYAGPLEGPDGVIKGIFGWRQVPQFIPDQWPQYSSIFSGNPSGYMRSKANANAAPLVTRYLTQTLIDAVHASIDVNGSAALSFGNLARLEFERNMLLNKKSGADTLTYTMKNWLRCLNATAYKTWMDWNMCCDVSVLQASPLSDEAKLKYLYPNDGPFSNSTSLLHVGVHWGVGSVSDINGTAQGDMFDVATSPNDMLLFITHHANIDRSAMTWQVNAAKRNPGIVRRWWGFPATKAAWSTAVEGCLLNDIANSNAPFASIFHRKPANATGYTHKEIIRYTRPGASPYTYDSLI